ncbi:MAG: methyltransferase domain-containing protein [Ignavibacteriales bacterium]|nr:methyltransferase domain-containing protein [Ignavibacteriales bacterium]
MEAIDYIIDFYLGTSRQGPGDTSQTKKALSFLPAITEQTAILDIGCGSGAQTIDLALNTGAQITAVDIFPAFLNELNEKCRSLHLENRITAKEASMDSLPFPENSFDIIWSEGAIYNIGFAHGMHYLRKFLKPEGYIAVTEITWLADERPAEVHDYWVNCYQEIDTADNKIKVIVDAGYKLVANFVLPEYCWLENYYLPQKEKIKPFLEKYNNASGAVALMDEITEEIAMYEKYKTFYGYVFYIAQKTAD